MPLVMAPLLFLGNVSYTQIRESAEGRVVDEIDSLMRVYRIYMNAKTKSATGNARILAESPETLRFLSASSTGDPTDFLTIAANVRKTYPDYYDIQVFDAAGLLAGRSTDASSESLIPRGFVQSILAGDEAPVTTFEDSAGGTASLLVGTQVRDANGSTIGAVTFSVALQNLEEGTKKRGIGDLGYYLVANEAGRVLYGHARRAVTEFPQHLDYSNWTNIATSGDFIEQTVAGVVTVVFGTRLEDGLYLYAVIPESQMYAASRKLGLVVLLVTVTGIALTFAALYLALHHIVLRPVSAIIDATHGVNSNGMTGALVAYSNDELGDLADAFNAMGDRLRDSDEHVQYLSYHDSLTGLPNRMLFRQQLEGAMAQASRENQKLALLYVDMDDFGRINDTLGHEIGDELLRRFSEDVVAEVRAGDLLSRISSEKSDSLMARLGGDEFVVMLRNVDDEYAPRTVARRIFKLLKKPFIIEGNELYVSSSIGIAMFPGDADTVDEIIKNADTAMYHAKDRGKNSYQYYSESMNRAAANRLQMETKLRKALELNQFELYYQPKVDPQTYAIVGAEALIRWNDPEIGMVPPDAFIKIAEDTGLIVPIGEWVLNQACIQLKEWQARSLPPISMAVNVSAIQVARQDLGFIVARSLRNSGVKAKYLDVEITESALMAGGDRTVRMLKELRSLDVSVSLDDFGTGYSSLSYLRKYPISNLKIDRSFFAEIESDDSSRSIVAAIIAMSKTLGMTVTAEGVENEVQMTFLREHECDFAQGYLISAPVPAHKFEALLTDTDGRSRSAAIS